MRWVEYVDFSFPRKDICRVKVFFKVLERKRGTRRRIVSRSDLVMSRFVSTMEILRAVRRVAKAGVTHEVDECLYLDNKRIFDPHKK